MHWTWLRGLDVKPIDAQGVEQGREGGEDVCCLCILGGNIYIERESVYRFLDSFPGEFIKLMYGSLSIVHKFDDQMYRQCLINLISNESRFLN